MVTWEKYYSRVRKYSSAFRAYSASVVQLAELGGQDEHEVAVGVTQYTFSAVQQERNLVKRTTTKMMNGVE